MAIGYGVPVPKGKTRKQVKAKRDREDAKALKHFRNLVWSREAEKNGSFAPGNYYACCQQCGRLVTRHPLCILTGEVHHRIGRRNKATRYDPANGVLLCNVLVNDCHRKAQEHLITV